MKVRMGALDSVLRTIPWREQRKRLISAAVFLLALVAVGIWWICGADATSTITLAVVGFGALNGDDVAAKLRAAADSEKSMAMSPEMALLTHLKSVLRLGLTVLNAKSVALTLWDKQSGQRLDWKMQRTEEFSEQVTTKAEPYLRPAPSEFCSAVYVRERQGIASLGVNWEDRPIESARLLEHLKALWQGSFKTLLLGYLDLGDRWQGTVAYTDVPRSSCQKTGLNELKQVVGVVSSGANLFEMASDCARVNERRCLARDLHDGVTQSVIATELQIALLDRENAAAGKGSNGVLANVRETLRRETRKLRGQIEELQRGEQSDSLRDMTEKLLNEFESETGISTNFICNMKYEQLPPRLGFELKYLLREVLSNVSKHSGAKQVDVYLLAGDGVHLHVQDDGCGLGFAGRYELAELGAIRNRPRTICERVEANGGGLILESFPGRGVRLEISLPLAPVHEIEGTEQVAMSRVSKRKPPQSDASARSIQRAS